MMRQLLKDEVGEMMTQESYCAWKAKPKQGAIPYESAKAAWLALTRKAGAVTDNKGEFRDEKDLLRVWGPHESLADEAISHRTIEGG